MYKIKHLFYLVTLLYLVACSNNIEEQERTNPSAFNVGHISAINGVPEYSGLTEETWSIFPNHNLIQFKTCLVDTALNITIVQQDFTIITPLGIKEKTTDQQGCLIWSDDIEMEYLAKETWFQYPVTIKSTSLHIGSVDIELAVNPWEKSGATTRDLRFETLGHQLGPNVLISAKHNIEKSDMPLNLEQLSLIRKNPRSQNGIISYEYDLQFTPVIKRIKINNDVSNEDIKKGIFLIKATIIEKDMSIDELFQLASTESKINVRGGVGTGKLTFSFPEQHRERFDSEFKMVFEIVPIGSPKNLSSFTGELQLKNIETNSTKKLTPIKENLVDIQKKELIETDNKNEEYIQNNENRAISLSYINARPGSYIERSSYQNNNKKLRSRFELCLANDLSRNGTEPLARTKIDIEVYNENGELDKSQEERSTITTAKGCIETHAVIEYQKYNCEQFLNYTIKINILDGPFKGSKLNRIVGLNPWNKNDFFYDIELGGIPPEITCTPPKIHLDKISYKNTGLDYDSFKVNQFLNLSLNRKLELTLNPKVEKSFSYDEEKLNASITFGEFEVTASILSPLMPGTDYLFPNFDNYKLISSTKSKASVSSSGILNTQLSFPFLVSETIYLSYKNLLLIQMKPTDKDSPLKETSVVVPYYGIYEGANLVATQISKLDELLLKKIKNIASKEYKTPGDFNKKEINDKPVNLYMKFVEEKGKASNKSFKSELFSLKEFNERQSSAQNNQLSKAEFRNISRGKTSIASTQLKKFCSLFEDRNMTDCLKTPSSHIKITPLIFIDELLKSEKDENRPFIQIANAKYVKDNTQSIKRGNSFFAAYGDRDGTQEGSGSDESFKESKSFEILWPGPVYFNMSKGWSKATHVFKEKVHAKFNMAMDRSYTSIDKESLSLDELVLKTYAKIRSCIGIISKLEAQKYIQICDDNLTTKKIEETWFFVGDTHAKEVGIISDGVSPSQEGQNQIIRGRANFYRVWEDFKMKDTIFLMEELGDLDPSASFKDHIDKIEPVIPYENKIENAFPGLFIPN